MMNPNTRNILGTCLYVVLSVAAVIAVAVPFAHRREGKQEPAIVMGAPKDTVRRISIILGGDVMAHMPQVMAARRDSIYDFAETFQYLKPMFDTTDIVIVNFETTVSANGTYTGYPMFSSPRELASGLRESGVDAVMLANNHICDKGRKGIETTIETVRKAGLQYTGAFADTADYNRHHPLILEAKGIKLAVLNYTYGTNGMPVPSGCVVNLIDTARIAADLGKADATGADVTIAFFHWGIEYSQKVARQEQLLASWCHDRGVDIVAGSHPHVIQPIEATVDSHGTVRGITIYSMGNLVSNQRKRNRDGGMLVRIGIEGSPKKGYGMDAEYMLTWTHIDYHDGRKYYHILPSPVADTLLKEGTPARRSYELFMDDSRKIIGNDIPEMKFGNPE